MVRWLTGRGTPKGLGLGGAARQMRPGEVRARWREFGRLRRTLFHEGGAVIETTGDALGRPGAVDARTVVQADGDVLCIVHEDVARDRSALAAHMEAVARWYAESSRTMAGLAAQLRLLWLAGSGVVAAAVALGPVDLWSPWPAAAALLAQPVARGVTGRLLRRGMGNLFG